MHTGSSHHDGHPITKGKRSNLSHSSSSSSASSFDPLLDLDDDEKYILDNSISKRRQESPDKPEPLKLPEHSPQTPEEWSMISASPRSRPTPLSSPPIQAMERPGSTYDPNRIPASVFTTNPTSSPMDWSVASNDSLFSIHTGNDSFSRDEDFLWEKSDVKNNSPSALPTVIEVAVENYRKTDIMWEDLGGKEVMEEMRKEVVKEKAEDHMPPSASKISNGREMDPDDGIRMSASTPRLSDESGNSSSSFAFPVLTGGGVGGRSCSGGSYSLRHVQSKPPDTEQWQEPQTPAAPPIAAEKTRWFSCFSCCPLCC